MPTADFNERELTGQARTHVVQYSQPRFAARPEVAAAFLALRAMPLATSTQPWGAAWRADKKKPARESGLNLISWRRIEETSEVCCGAQRLSNHML
jgi:hypothetical protein